MRVHHGNGAKPKICATITPHVQCAAQSSVDCTALLTQSLIKCYLQS